MTRAEHLAALLGRHPHPVRVAGDPLCAGCFTALRTDLGMANAQRAHQAELLDQFITDEVTARAATTNARGSQ